MDLLFLERPGARKVQLDLFYDYRTNVELYPAVAGVPARAPAADADLLGPGRHLLHPEGGRAYLRDLPDAELHLLDSGHFAVEDSLEEIAAHIKRFYDETVTGRRADARTAGMREHAMRVLSVNVGLPHEVWWRGRPVTTGIFKEPVAGRVPLVRLNLDGDRQADLRVHGGPDKAVYAYPSEFYELWRRERPELDFPWGQFGENLTTQGLRDSEVSVGDRFRVGTAELVVTQPRIPCFKLGIRMGRDRFVTEFLERGLLGFYLGRPRGRGRGGRSDRRGRTRPARLPGDGGRAPLLARSGRRRRDAPRRRPRRAARELAGALPKEARASGMNCRV